MCPILPPVAVSRPQTVPAPKAWCTKYRVLFLSDHVICTSTSMEYLFVFRQQRSCRELLTSHSRAAPSLCESQITPISSHFCFGVLAFWRFGVFVSVLTFLILPMPVGRIIRSGVMGFKATKLHLSHAGSTCIKVSTTRFIPQV